MSTHHAFVSPIHWQSYEGDPEHVANAEKYFLCVSKIPRLELRLQLFAFKQGFETQV